MASIMQRSDGRAFDALRPVTIQRNFLDTAEGSVLITCGRTKVICTAAVMEEKPSWLLKDPRGWITAEYGMLPKSCKTRIPRNKGDGRTAEIQRLVGRALRAAVNLELMPDFSIWVDCDVLQADGGTRTAAVTGACVALADAFRLLLNNGLISKWPMRELVAATSVGLVNGAPMLDLCYTEDSLADVDMNVVATASGLLVEIQGTAERHPFSLDQHHQLLSLAQQGVKELIALQQKVLEEG